MSARVTTSAKRSASFLREAALSSGIAVATASRAKVTK